MEPQRKALGRGMSSLIPKPLSAPAAELTTASVSSVPYHKLPVAILSANPNQPRKFFDQQKIEELAASIREKGILQPILVSKVLGQDGRYEIVSGERRFRAAQVAGLTEVPAIVREAEPKERLELAIIENVQREDLDPVEEAAAYQDLIDHFGYTQEVVADKVGKDRATVANMIRLLKLPLKVKQALQSGQISMGHARALLAVPEIEKQLYFVDRIVEEGWSVRELELRVRVKRLLGVKKGKIPANLLPPALISLVDDLRRRMGTQVRIVPTGKKGKIIIEYYSEVDLNRLYQLIVK